MSALVVLPTLAKFGLTLAFDACGAGVCLAPQPIRRRCTDRCSFDIVFAAIDFVDPRSVFHADADEREQAQEVPADPVRSSTRTRPDKLLHNIQLAGVLQPSQSACGQPAQPCSSCRSEQLWSVARLRKRELCTARVPHCGTVRAAH